MITAMGITTSSSSSSAWPLGCLFVNPIQEIIFSAFPGGYTTNTALSHKARYGSLRVFVPYTRGGSSLAVVVAFKFHHFFVPTTGCVADRHFFVHASEYFRHTSRLSCVCCRVFITGACFVRAAAAAMHLSGWLLSALKGHWVTCYFHFKQRAIPPQGFCKIRGIVLKPGYQTPRAFLPAMRCTAFHLLQAVDQLPCCE